MSRILSVVSSLVTACSAIVSLLGVLFVSVAFADVHPDEGGGPCAGCKYQRIESGILCEQVGDNCGNYPADCLCESYNSTYKDCPCIYIP